VANLLLLTGASGTSSGVLPSLGLLGHVVRILPIQAAPLLDAPDHDLVLVDARHELAAARQTCRLLQSTGSSPLLAIVTEGGLVAVAADWGVDDVIVDHAGPAEVEARLRLALGRAAATGAAGVTEEIRSGDLSIDEATYQAKLGNQVLDLTFKEFELLKFLAQHPGRVFTRAQLLQEVWGYDYFGGTRTVDVHVRRLRAKLGADREALIGTVRNVGYKFVAQPLVPLPETRAEESPTAPVAATAVDAS
jgi:DNA-binding response OmpR family regulator